MSEITTAEELDALPAECLLRSTRPGYGPTYLVTFDCGDGALMFTLTAGDEIGTVTSAEAIDECGPFVLLYRPDRPSNLAPAGATVTQEAVEAAARTLEFYATSRPPASARTADPVAAWREHYLGGARQILAERP